MCQFNNSECVSNESGTDDVECHKEVASGRKGAGVIMSVVNGRGLQLECVREGFLMRYCSCFLYFRTVIQGYGVRRRDLGVRLRGMTKGVYKRTDENVL